jgi:predicted TIM-barrel fold metal-dependent hydrolase
VIKHFPALAERLDESASIVKNLAGKSLPLEDEGVRADGLLVDADIHTQVVSVRTSVLVGKADLFSDAARRIALADAVNAYLSDLAAPSQDRYRAFADAPFEGVAPEAATEAVLKALDRFNLSGVALETNYRGAYLDHPGFDELLQELDRRRAAIFLHPSYPPDLKAYEEYRLYSIVGFPTETTLSILRLVYSGTLDKYPNIPIITSHLGGFLPYIWWRLGVVGQQDREVFRPQMQEDPRTYLTRLYYDLALTDEESLRLAVARVGIEQLLVGTDYPYGRREDLGRTRAMIDGLGLPVVDCDRIRSGNAATVPGLLA